MRNMLFTGAVALSLIAGAALAQPPGLKDQHGAKADAAGKALYTYDMDTMKGMSHCENRCAEAWPPLVADANAKASGDWTVINRGGGVKQWAYKDKPVYTFARDKAGEAGTGESVPNWKLLK
jgi:predicted lipoprotein with Yx(FWY)xxD motif